MAYYKLNTEKKTITIDTKVKPSEFEKNAVQMYLVAGYVLREKSEKRAAAARERAAKNGFGKKKKAKKAEEKVC